MCMGVTDIILGILSLGSFGCGCAIAAIILGSIAVSRNRREDKEEDEKRTYDLACGGLVLALLAIFLGVVMVALLYVGLIPLMWLAS